jgi:hypothetical protein
MGKDWRDGQRLESKEKDEMRGSSTGGGSSKCSRQMCEYENDAKSTDPGRKPEEANNKTPLPEEYRDPDAATRRPERRAADGWEPYFRY